MKEEIKLKDMIDFLENIYKDIKKQPTLEEELEKERKFINKIKGDNKEEIKEILDRVKKNPHHDFILSNKHTQQLLDYITNLQEDLEYQKQAEQEYNEKHTKLMKKYKELQEENEKLNKLLLYANDEVVSYASACIDLKGKIDKAIIYIHNHQPVFELSSKEQIQEWFEKEYYLELLNILQGEDTNVNITN